MGRPLAPHGSMAAFRRHKRLGETPCGPCAAANDAENAARRGKEGQIEPRPLAMLPTALAMDAELAVEYRTELLANLKLVKAAMAKVTETDPLKIVPLSKRHSELLAELRTFAGAKQPGASAEGETGEVDPFESIFGAGGAPRRPATAPRT